jgi:ferric-dicitrate binding protein FerR (iron transport regulator)
VRLQGEGFFEVKHQASHPFIVQSNGVRTIVLGTSFKIETFRPNTISISVATGKVSVDRLLPGKSYQPLAILTPGKRVVYNTEKQQAVTDDMPVNDLLVWKEGGMVFRDLTLAEICQRLERWYKVKIVIEKSLKSLRISASFGNVNIGEVMEVISRTADLRYTLSNQIIYLKKNSMKKT